VQRFVKTGSAARADAFAAEADGLQALKQAGLRVPEVVSHGVESDEAFIVLEYLELQSTGDFAALGRMLAAAHRHAGRRFGWHRDNYIGATPQQNGDCARNWRWQGKAASTSRIFLSRICSRGTGLRRRSFTATFGAAMRALSPAARWFSTRPCITATVKPTLP